MKPSYLIWNKCQVLTTLLPVILLVLFGCKSGSDKTTPDELAVPPPPEVSISISKVDDVVVEHGKTQSVGKQVMVEGIISDAKVILCVLVHPMSGDTWWTQSLPSPPIQIDGNLWRWRTIVYCGTQELGLNEEFEIVALAESQRAVCIAGKTLKTGDFPIALPRSEIITVIRSR